MKQATLSMAITASLAALLLGVGLAGSSAARAATWDAGAQGSATGYEAGASDPSTTSSWEGGSLRMEASSPHAYEGGAAHSGPAAVEAGAHTLGQFGDGGLTQASGDY
ncbi:MAG TPA: hypothetical protein VKU41_03385 [Polyangiaceae bacterium]|nr:hypothetical protein [Polyangiaceae bacterium]